ncbi:uncharacterized protein RCC_06277 [Ramularia collo-cygni]|uniref:Uncharacterized protein n=1 Tax=Ramularia collo-cygni TaxID=112498 RepID=A0A2D3V6S2_9PEZI|nr:uncharacterized protein RCC_06277 [Ramularia collo-cygni]CZT20417.1 uncharacterized protein RCC_06277 [Ramularia collo-cygni]
MCFKTAPRHPKCGHAAHGTASEGARLSRCDRSKLRGPCGPIQWEHFDVRRGYCDSCIINGEFFAQKSMRLDPGVYCRRLGASYNDLRNANPEAWSRASQEQDADVAVRTSRFGK